jgi:SAM-dependent methyltransferase
MITSRTVPRFEEVTETTGTPVSAEGASMLYMRYHVGAELARGKRVLDVACGSGQGLGLVGRSAAQLVAGDISAELLRPAQAHYGGRVPLVQLSAESLPFADGAFDVVLCFEASYYVPRMDLAFREIARVVAPGGTAAFVNANPERPDFIRSPHSVQYHTADQFRAALEGVGLMVTVEGAFPLSGGGRGGRGARAVFLARRALEALGLVPKTLRGRSRLKRIVYGKLREIPAEVPDGFGQLAPRVPLLPGPVTGYKVIYVTGRKADRRVA